MFTKSCRNIQEISYYKQKKQRQIVHKSEAIDKYGEKRQLQTENKTKNLLAKTV